MNRYFHYLPVESFTSICRICLMYAEVEKFSIMEFSWETHKLKDILNVCTPLKVDDNDEMPKYMCSVCIRKLYETYTFLTTCKRSDSILKQILINNRGNNIAIASDFVIENNVNRILIENNETNRVIEIDVNQILSEKKASDNNVIEIDLNRILSGSKATTVIEDYVPMTMEHNITLDIKETDGEDNDDIIYVPYNENKNPEDPQAIKNEFDKSKTEENHKEPITLRTINDLKGEIEPIKIKSGPNIGDPYIIKLKPNIKSKGPPYICVSCHAVFQAYEDLKTHKLERKHNVAKNYVCPYCNKRMTNHRYAEHARTHTGEKPNKCTTCGKAFNGKADLRRHMGVHSDVKRYTCGLCKKGFTQKQCLVNHERKHTGERDLCLFCGKVFISPSCRLAHEKKHIDNGDPKKNDKTKCPLCDKVFYSEETLKRHILVRHTPQDVGANFCCDICGKTCVDKLQLVNHIRYSHGDNDDPSMNKGNNKCPLCDKVLTTKQALKTHILMTHGPENLDELFHCETCGKTCVTKFQLQSHVRFTHPVDKFRCTLCEREYKQKSGLDKHMETHTGKNSYPCELCGKHFAIKNSLLQHRRLHTGDTQYQCKVCFRVCTTKRNLEDHMRTHTGEKPFICEYCSKAFALKGNLYEHVKIHTGDKKHQCTICEKKFYNRRSLKKHKSVHEKTK